MTHYDVKTPTERIEEIVKLGGVGLKSDVLSHLLTSISTFALVLLLIATFSNILEADTDKLASVQEFTSMLNVIMRHINVLIRRPKLREFLHDMDVIWKAIFSSKDSKETNKDILVFTVFNICSSLFVPIMLLFDWMRVNAGVKYEEIKPYNPGYSVIPTTWPYANLAYWLVLYICTFLSNSTSIVLLYASTKYIVLLMKRLRSKIESGQYGQEEIKLHQGILRLIRCHNSIFSTVFFFVSVINSFEIAGRLFRFMVAINKKDDDIITHISVAIVLICTPFIVSYCGSLITKQNEHLHRSAYQNMWYEERPEKRKELYMIMTAATNPASFHFKHLITFNMAQFTTFCQAVYSYVAILKVFLK